MSTQNDVGPGLAPALILGILTLVLGAVLGTLSVVAQPVIAVPKTPDPETVKPGMVYYIKGNRLGRTAWEAKEDAWKAGTVAVLSLSETELNQWSQDRLKLETISVNTEEPSWTDQFKITVSPVNFRILEDRLQLSTEIRMDGIFSDRPFVYQIYGRFTETGDGVKFTPESGTLGSAPLGSIPVFSDLLFSLVGKQFEAAEAGEWLAESLSTLDAAEIADGKLVLRRRSEG